MKKFKKNIREINWWINKVDNIALNRINENTTKLDTAGKYKQNKKQLISEGDLTSLGGSFIW